MISFQNVSFTYAESGNGGVLDLNLVVRSGECVLLCGPSGCGKTTVTRLANGLIPHFFHGNLSGQVNVNGMDTRETEIAVLSDAVGTVFQNPRTQFFNTDTDSEIVFGLENRGIPRETLRSRLDELTEELHLSELRGRNIFELSGGEKQKIAFSSVYASAPDVLVFDEPSSNLDMKAIGELADLIQRAKISGKTILIAEHRIWYLMDIVDRVVYMQDGRIASDMEAAAFKALPEADIRRMGLRVRDLSVSESGGAKTIAADGLLSVQKISVRLGGRNVLNILGLLVVFRFFPTMRTELKGVGRSMKNRGLTAAGQLLTHPLQSMEYVLVPFLLRVLQLADQLSVSAVARGAERPGVRGSYYEKRIGARDHIAAAACAIVTASYLVLERSMA